MPHTIQNRLPQYLVASAKIFKSVKTEGKSLNNTLYSSGKARGLSRDIKRIAALVANALHHSNELDEMYKFIKSKYKGDVNFDEHKVCILITELLWGKGYLPEKDHDILNFINEHQEKLFAMKDPSYEGKQMKVTLPRYVRINMLKTTENFVLKSLENEGWVEQDSGASYQMHLKRLAKLEEPNFMRDFHYSEILAFPPRTNFFNHPLCEENLLILQAKSTCVPVKLLNPNPGSIVLDMCAAPGMKTSQIAAHMNDIGVIHAVEQDPARFATLQMILKDTGVTCATAYNEDVLSIKPDHFADVTHILVDPSCSGSGMDRIEMTPKSEEQVENLAKFQFRVLCKALSFPAIRRIVYSTCSVFEKENEAVVTEALAFTGNNFKIVDAWPDSSKGQFTRGSSKYPGGELTIYILPEQDLSTGFYVAVLERISKKKRKNKEQDKFDSSVEVHEESTSLHDIDNYNVEKQFVNEKKGKKKMFEDIKNDFTEIKESELLSYREEEVEQIKKEKKKRVKIEIQDHFDCLEAAETHKKKSKKRKLEEANDQDCINSDSNEENIKVRSKKCKKKNKHKNDEYDEEEIDESVVDDSTKHKKKKKKKEKCNFSSENLLIEEEEVKVKKQKKLKLLESQEDINSSSENLEMSNVSKKKSKKRQLNETIFAKDCINFHSDEEKIKVKSKKCKKKNKYKDDEDKQELLESSILQDDSIKHKKKKKKKEKHESLDETSTKKHKKNKNLGVEEFGEIGKMTLLEGDAGKKKKKKSHNRDVKYDLSEKKSKKSKKKSDDEMNGTVIIDTTEQKKSKKGFHKENISENIEVQKSALKKKRKP